MRKYLVSFTFDLESKFKTAKNVHHSGEVETYKAQIENNYGRAMMAHNLAMKYIKSNYNIEALDNEVEIIQTSYKEV